MKSFNYEGCEITILNNTKIISNQKAFEFSRSYILHYLSEELSFIPREVLNKETVKIELTNNKTHIKIHLNNRLHIELNIKGFHNAQLHIGALSGWHYSFFQQIYHHKVSGIDIIENYPF